MRTSKYIIKKLPFIPKKEGNKYEKYQYTNKEPFFGRGRAILVEKFGPIILHMSEKCD